MKVYLLQHVREHHDTEEIKSCGIFSTEERAANAKAQLLTQPGFSKYPEGFEICEYVIDRIEWSEGFVTWAEALENME